MLLKKKATTGRFKFETTAEQARDILASAYMAEVRYRRGECDIDKELDSKLYWVAERLVSNDNRFGFLFCGDCGNGKTTMMYALRSAIAFASMKNMWEEPLSLQVVGARDILEARSDYKMFRELRGQRLLGVDDMGLEATEIQSYGNIMQPLTELLEYRYNRQLFTVVTTNVPTKGFRDKYGVRLADRFNEMFNVLEFTNKSFRR